MSTKLLPGTFVALSMLACTLALTALEGGQAQAQAGAGVGAAARANPPPPPPPPPPPGGGGGQVVLFSVTPPGGCPPSNPNCAEDDPPDDRTECEGPNCPPPDCVPGMVCNPPCVANCAPPPCIGPNCVPGRGGDPGGEPKGQTAVIGTCGDADLAVKPEERQVAQVGPVRGIQSWRGEKADTRKLEGNATLIPCANVENGNRR